MVTVLLSFLNQLEFHLVHNFEPNQNPSGSKLKGKLSPRSYSFQTEWNTIEVTVFLSILNQINFDLIQNCEPNGIPVGWNCRHERFNKPSHNKRDSLTFCRLVHRWMQKMQNIFRMYTERDFKYGQ